MNRAIYKHDLCLLGPIQTPMCYHYVSWPFCKKGGASGGVHVQSSVKEAGLYDPVPA